MDSDRNFTARVIPSEPARWRHSIARCPARNQSGPGKFRKRRSAVRIVRLQRVGETIAAVMNLSGYDSIAGFRSDRVLIIALGAHSV
jgi:hypothetical protein